MRKVVELSVIKRQRSQSLEAAWERFVAADRLAKTSLQLEDGIAAGKAYREFLELTTRAS
jgi:hypothetical protein